MHKISIEERPDWRERVEREGFAFHTIDGERYWDESGYYRFTREQVTQDIEQPTRELHHMCLDVVERVVESEELLSGLAIPPAFFDLVRKTKQKMQRSKKKLKKKKGGRREQMAPRTEIRKRVEARNGKMEAKKQKKRKR